MGKGNETMNVNEDAQAVWVEGMLVWVEGIQLVEVKGEVGEVVEEAKVGKVPVSLDDSNYQEHYLRQDEEALREYLEETARVEQEYLDRYRAEQEYEARMDWMHESHWQSDEDMLANNPTQTTQQSGVQQEDDATASSTKKNRKRPMSIDMQADEITPPPIKHNLCEK
ncbi:hypothetical protein Tco_1417117 [Tanacetum coccineum]